jgi:DNA-binding beta-propeller fold protein YncE
MIDAGTGRLTELPGSPFPIRARVPGRSIINGDGRFIYSLNVGASNGIIVLARDPATGSIAQVQFEATVDLMADLAIAGSGRYLIVTPAADDLIQTLHTYSIDEMSGRIRRVTGSTVGSASRPVGVVSDRTGRWVIATTNDGAIESFSIGLLGVLTPVDRIPNGALGFRLAMDKDNRFVYVQNTGNSISGFLFDVNTGRLNTAAGSPFETANAPSGIVAVRRE